MACGRPAIALARGGAAEVVTADTGILYDEDTDEGLAGAIAAFERRVYDEARLRARALEFRRSAYREAMENVLAEAVQAFRTRHEDPGAVERLAAAPRRTRAMSLVE